MGRVSAAQTDSCDRCDAISPRFVPRGRFSFTAVRQSVFSRSVKTGVSPRKSACDPLEFDRVGREPAGCRVTLC